MKSLIVIVLGNLVCLVELMLFVPVNKFQSY